MSVCRVSGFGGRTDGEIRGLSKGCNPTRGDRTLPSQCNRRNKMKMVKSLLLGSAAGIVAVAGAQAADLPVKAKPVEYVKICSLYGAGYYYMPGTDICLKLGGYVRYQLNVGPGNNISGGPQHGVGGRNTRIDEQDVLQRVRALLTIDTRQQTAYGTLRSYLLMGYSHDVSAPTSAPSLYV